MSKHCHFANTLMLFKKFRGRCGEWKKNWKVLCAHINFPQGIRSVCITSIDKNENRIKKKKSLKHQSSISILLTVWPRWFFVVEAAWYTTGQLAGFLSALYPLDASRIQPLPHTHSMPQWDHQKCLQYCPGWGAEEPSLWTIRNKKTTGGYCFLCVSGLYISI